MTRDFPSGNQPIVPNVTHKIIYMFAGRMSTGTSFGDGPPLIRKEEKTVYTKTLAEPEKCAKNYLPGLLFEKAFDNRLKPAEQLLFTVFNFREKIFA